MKCFLAVMLMALLPIAMGCGDDTGTTDDVRPGVTDTPRTDPVTPRADPVTPGTPGTPGTRTTPSTPGAPTTDVSPTGQPGDLPSAVKEEPADELPKS